MAEDAIKAESETDKKILHVYPLVKVSSLLIMLNNLVGAKGGAHESINYSL